MTKPKPSPEVEIVVDGVLYLWRRQRRRVARQPENDLVDLGLGAALLLRLGDECG